MEQEHFRRNNMFDLNLMCVSGLCLMFSWYRLFTGSTNKSSVNLLVKEEIYQYYITSLDMC